MAHLPAEQGCPNLGATLPCAAASHRYRGSRTSVPPTVPGTGLSHPLAAKAATRGFELEAAVGGRAPGQAEDESGRDEDHLHQNRYRLDQ